MKPLTDEDRQRAPAELLAGARRGEFTLLTEVGMPSMLGVPLAGTGNSHAALADLAAMLYDTQRISLARAAEIAELAYVDMLDEMGVAASPRFDLRSKNSNVNSPPSDPDPTSALPRVVVSDAEPLIALGQLNLPVLLPRQHSQVQVPQQVIKECTIRPDREDAARILAAMNGGWLTPCHAMPIEDESLGRGERAAIARALEIGAGLLVNDMAARLLAATRGIPTTGTLGVLVCARQAGAISSSRPLIQQLGAGGQCLGAQVVALALAAAGEEDQ